MGSGINSSFQGKYVGNGSATAFEIKPGFEPKVVKIRSTVGEVVYQKEMPGAWKQLDSGAPSFLAAGALEITEFGIKIATTDTGLNGNGTSYYVEMY